MNRAKEKRPGEQRFPIIFPSVPVQTLRVAAKTYFAFRRVGYHFREDWKYIFLGFNEHLMQSRHAVGSAECRVATKAGRITISNCGKIIRTIAAVRPKVKNPHPRQRRVNSSSEILPERIFTERNKDNKD